MKRHIPWHLIARKAENGSADAGTFADTAYIPYLVTLLLLGLVLALVGFWRISASYATLRGAHVGAVAPASGNDALSATWHDWTNSDGPTAGLVLDTQNRAVRASINTSAPANLTGVGPTQFSISAQTQSRSERFYPGKPVCDGFSNCDE